MRQLHCFTFCTFVMMASSPAMVGQFEPEGSEVIGYYPQIADGGSATQQWVTSLTFVNPHTSLAASGTVYLYNDDGTPLALDFGRGQTTTLNFSIPAQGTVQFTSSGAPPAIVTGWAAVYSSLPLEGVVQFRAGINGKALEAVSAQATPASHLFRSPATASTGVAVANPYNISIPIRFTAIDSNGNTVANASITLPPLGHHSFGFLNQIFPSIPSSFRGSILITTDDPTIFFVAWMLSGDAGVFASYPPAGLGWPVSQYQRIWRAWQKLINAAGQMYTLAGIKLGTPPTLVVDYSTGQINSYANGPANEVHIFMNLAELISDSESELGFVIGHEVGHIIQYQTGGPKFVPSDIEWDADEMGMILSLLAGYDPYASAGALAKLAMASGDAALVNQNFDNIALQAGMDLHGSFNDRLALIFSEMQSLCAISSLQSFCTEYKSLIHPHLPSIAPLSRTEPRSSIPQRR